MKLVVCIIHNRDKGKIMDDLVGKGFKSTIIGSTGGFLREGNTTFLIGVEETRVQELLGLVSQNSQAREQVLNVAPMEAGVPGAFIPNPVKVPVGGSVVFVLDVEQFARF
ncbi:MAG TPA: cyclic-di-AMP receptor [Fimbriimonadaceae bacterium]